MIRQASDVPDALLRTFRRLLGQQTTKGIRTYGTRLTTHNGRNAGEDAFAEWLDLGAYIQQLVIEHTDLQAENALLRDALRAYGVEMAPDGALVKTDDLHD